jgi:hypothetical protein
VLDSSSDEEVTGPIAWRMPRRLLPRERKASLFLSNRSKNAQQPPSIYQQPPSIHQQPPSFQVPQISPQLPQISSGLHNMQPFNNNIPPNLLQAQQISGSYYLYPRAPAMIHQHPMMDNQIMLNPTQQVPINPYYPPVPMNPQQYLLHQYSQQYHQHQPNHQIPPQLFNSQVYTSPANSSNGESISSPQFSPPIEAYNVGASTSGTSQKQFQRRGQNGNRDPRSNLPNYRDPRAANHGSNPRTYGEHRRQSRWDSNSNKRPSPMSASNQQQQNNKQRRFDDNSRRPDNNQRPVNVSREEIRLREYTRRVREVDRVEARKPSSNNNTASSSRIPTAVISSRSETSATVISSRPETSATVISSRPQTSATVISSRPETSATVISSRPETSTTERSTPATSNKQTTSSSKSKVVPSKPPPNTPKDLEATIEKIQGKCKQLQVVQLRKDSRLNSTYRREKPTNGGENSSNNRESEAIVQPEATPTTNSTASLTQLSVETATEAATENVSQTATTTPSTTVYLPFNTPTSIPGLESPPLISPESIKKEKSSDKTKIPADLVIKTEIKTEKNGDDETDSNPDSAAETASNTSVATEVNDDDDELITGLEKDPEFLILAASLESAKQLTTEEQEEEEEDRLEQKQSFLRCRNLHDLTGELRMLFFLELSYRFLRTFLDFCIKFHEILW